MVNNSGGTMGLGVPCVCMIPTPVGPVPVPLFNLILTFTIIPNVLNIFYGALPIVNQMTENPVSVGSAPNGGVATSGICQDAQNISCSTVLCVGAMMATAVCHVTGHNKDFNSVGMHATPSPPWKWILAR